MGGDGSLWRRSFGLQVSKDVFLSSLGFLRLYERKKSPPRLFDFRTSPRRVLLLSQPFLLLQRMYQHPRLHPPPNNILPSYPPHFSPRTPTTETQRDSHNFDSRNPHPLSLLLLFLSPLPNPPHKPHSLQPQILQHNHRLSSLSSPPHQQSRRRRRRSQEMSLLPFHRLPTTFLPSSLRHSHPMDYPHSSPPPFPFTPLHLHLLRSRSISTVLRSLEAESDAVGGDRGGGEVEGGEEYTEV